MDTRKPLGVAEVVGVVLAGGRSRRFGVDKARVEVGGEPLVVRTVRVLAEVLGEVVVVGDVTLRELWPERSGAAGAPGPVPDSAPDFTPSFMDDPREGPLGAVIAAWRRCLRPLVVLACDLPLMDRETVARLARPTDGARVPEVSLGEDGPRRQWLAAHYGAESLHLMATLWDNGERSIGRAALAAEERGGLVLEGAGEPWEAGAFADADTPDALARLLEQSSVSRR